MIVTTMYFILLARSMDYDLRFGKDLGLGSSSLTLNKDITKFTVAFWMKVADSESADPGTPLSYAVEDKGNLATFKLFLKLSKSRCLLRQFITLAL